jgi:hypothetical protein
MVVIIEPLIELDLCLTVSTGKFANLKATHFKL